MFKRLEETVEFASLETELNSVTGCYLCVKGEVFI
jgi:hypothetical protein